MQIPGYKILIGVAALAFVLFIVQKLFLKTSPDQGEISSNTGAGCYESHGSLYSVPELTESQKKAEQGNAVAETDMGNYYRRDDMIPHYSRGEPDYAEAAKWYRKAADQGHPPAQYNLAYQYFHGYGIQQDSKEAYFWILLALQRDPPGYLGLPRCEYYQLSEKAEKSLSGEEIAEVKTRVKEWKPNVPDSVRH